jgi:hypothetical protein
MCSVGLCEVSPSPCLVKDRAVMSAPETAREWRSIGSLLLAIQWAAMGNIGVYPYRDGENDYIRISASSNVEQADKICQIVLRTTL